MSRILIVEDDPKQAELVRRYAVSEGHQASVVADGRAALDAVRRRRPDLVVLDVMLPRLSGLDVCRMLRADAATEAVRILVLTARASEDDLLLGLDTGADDYLTKPYSPRELMARCRALLRRPGSPDQSPAPPDLVVGDLVVSEAAHTVRHHGEVVDVTPVEFALLVALAGQPGRAFTRDQLLDRLHGAADSAHVTRRTVDVHVANLRRKLDPALIRTVYGVGYAFATVR